MEKRWIARFKKGRGSLYHGSPKYHIYIYMEDIDWVYNKCDGPPKEWMFKYPDKHRTLERFLSSEHRILADWENEELPIRLLCGLCFSVRNYKVKVSPYESRISQ